MRIIGKPPCHLLLSFWKSTQAPPPIYVESQGDPSLHVFGDRLITTLNLAKPVVHDRYG